MVLLRLIRGIHVSSPLRSVDLYNDLYNGLEVETSVYI